MTDDGLASAPDPADDLRADDLRAGDRTAHLLDVALGRAEPRSFWVDLPAPDPTALRRDRIGRVRVGRARQLLVGGAVVVVGVVAFTGLQPDDPGLPEGPQAAVASTPLPSATDAASEAARDDRPAAIVLPEAWRDRCRDAPGLDDAAAAAVVCAPTTGVTRLELRRIDDPAMLGERFAQLVPDRAQGDGPSQCALGRAEVRSWSRPAEPAAAVGVYACRVVDGAAEIVWVDRPSGLLARAVAADADLAGLFTWWLTAELPEA